MGEVRIASKDLLRQILSAGFCSEAVEAPWQIIEWARIGEIIGFSPLAILNGDSQRNYRIPSEAWKAEIRWGHGSFDAETGNLRVEFYTSSSQHLSAPKIEFQLSEAVTALLPIDPKELRQKKRHPSSYAEKDAPLIEEMQKLIKSGAATSPYPAALQVADKAVGGGNTESKVRRLVDRYNATLNENG